MSIAKITDTGSHILLKADCLSDASITGTLVEYGVAGTINGSATTDPVLGLDCSAGSASWIGINQVQKLDYEGQIVFDATTIALCQYDNDATEPSGSQGVDRASIVYLFSARDALNANTAQVTISAAEALSGKLHQSDTNVSASATTVGKDTTTNVCIWFKGKAWGVKLNGEDYLEGTRANYLSTQFNRLNFGANFGGGTSFFGYYVKNIVVSRKSPRLTLRQTAISIGIFGNSFATNAGTAGSPRFDGTLTYLLESKLSQRGSRARVYVDGHPGKTTTQMIADGDLATFIDTPPTVAILMITDNDITSDVSSTLANITQIVESIFFENYSTNTTRTATKKILLCNSGSLRQDAANDTVANNARRVLADGYVDAAIVAFDAAYPAYAGSVIKIDLGALLGGDVDGNLNYQGALNQIGNVTVAPVAEPDNRHPSSLGYVNLCNGLIGHIV